MIRFVFEAKSFSARFFVFKLLETIIKGLSVNFTKFDYGPRAGIIDKDTEIS